MTGDLDSSSDQKALLSFKHQLIDPRNALSGWTSNSSHCNWYGVLCSNGSRVESLQLSGLGLAGSLHPSLSNLTFLHTLNFSHNLFHGQFQLEFNRLSLLQHIDLRNNSINGTVPALLSTCHNLETLRFNGNRFSGHLPPELGNLQKLTRLEISINNLTGSLPSSYGNLSSLTNLRFARNKLSGEIPSEFGMLRNLQHIQLSDNNLSGQIPSSIFNVTSLVYISLTLNNLSGNLPNDMGQALPNLMELHLATNRFDGIIPVSLSNASNIEALDLSRNGFHGPVPLLGNMKKLLRVDLGHNFLSSTTARNSELIDSLSSCKQLEILWINSNRLSGELPSVANLSGNMQHFCFAGNFLTGPLPQGMDKFQNLISLSMETNSFTGEIPKSLATLKNLQSFLVYQNMLSGEIPEIFADFTRVFDVVMGNNQFSGRIPTSLGGCQKLETLDLSWNRLNGSIPKEIFVLSGLKYLILFQNDLWGPLPDEVGHLKELEVIDVSCNKLSGSLTSSISGCSKLLHLNMSENNISGQIPGSLDNLMLLEVLDLSSNNLSGPIPQDLEKLEELQLLNLSFNNLEGEVPTGNFFLNTSAFSIQGNHALCGSDEETARSLTLPQCKTSSGKSNHLLIILISSVGCVIIMCFISCFVWAFISKRKKKMGKGSNFSLPLKGLPPMISYSDIRHATSNFADENLIGKGGFGSVYKGIFNMSETASSNNSTTLAVKVIDLQQSKAIQSFLAECEALRNVRHRNLVKIITSCSSVDHKGDQFKALIMEFMPNGNLDKWLYLEDEESGVYLTLLQRLNIAIDIASAIDYLHNDCEPAVVHCDLKPANVLLDEGMAAHLGDFGLARFLSPNPSQGDSSTVAVKGSFGYIAPEYGLSSKASTSGDVYSFGILLLEMFIAKKPTDEMFQEGLSLNKFASAADENQISEKVDPKLFKNNLNTNSNIDSSSRSSSGSINNDIDHRATAKYEGCVADLIRVGLSCAAQLPKDRLSMREALAKLHEIKNSAINPLDSNNSDQCGTIVN
ncbi:hypothetical protein CCACVL1_18096 [Corchorus capsularis]|uniref:non-specific serine/threonine protein kinase n=1 Tax=Corchorus capsularis TaxID=210143 RepID=A0A1R3HN30_COCAP|nr:hypothetical protein CCACVL1_18096 [Corchorus capsularis]